ncbi:MAG: hypothetical protein CMQ41_15745 [Gammaproteobacteria bacterium]|nr:hypothetical protein [Gammaproteobacteria bacterium]
MFSREINYNQASSASMGWKPNWFGDFDEIDENLIEAIKKWQKDHFLTQDGLVGPTTFRRVFTERESNIDLYLPDRFTCKETNHIVYNGNLYEIDWPHVTLWSEENGLEAKKGTYKPNIGKRDIDFFVNHWDVCLNSASCLRVVNNRGISVQFLIDNDGRIFQTMDMSHIAWHAGGRGWNARSVGVEISNAYYPKYQSWYEKNGFGPRPLVEGARVHNRTLKPFLGFYPVQMEALKALWKAINTSIGVPLTTPCHKNGKVIKGVVPDTREVYGFVNHYHLTRKKIDCAGLDIKGMLADIKGM